MTNSTRLIGLIMSALLWAVTAAATAAAQGPASSWDGVPLPGTEGAGAPGMTMPQGGEELPSPTDINSVDAPPAYPSPTVDGYELDQQYGGADVGGLWNELAPIESTGTWLQRGFWYAEADAVVMNRIWNRDNRIYAAADPDVERIDFFNNALSVAALLDTNRLMILDAAQPGQDTAVRFTLGHFMFRDSRNRDHTVEFTAFGGGEWDQQRVITSPEAFGLFVPFVIDGGNLSFDGSSKQNIDYSSNFKSFEANYHVRQRLGHDQLVMDPNGGWHRAANSGFEREYLAGLRFLEVGDRFDWTAEDVAIVGNDGRYLIHTDNNLFGLQFGAGQKFQAPRWSIGALAKGGVYVNDAGARSQLDFSINNANDFDLQFTDNEIAFVGEFKFQARFHITPNVSLRTAYELMYITSVALAPSQATFIPEFSYLNTTGDPFYHGASFGIEGYW